MGSWVIAAVVLGSVLGPIAVADDESEYSRDRSGPSENPERYNTPTHAAPDDPPGWDPEPAPIATTFPPSESTFEMRPGSSADASTMAYTRSIGDLGTFTVEAQGGGGGGGGQGGKLGNAPEALTAVLERFLERGRQPPENFPVPYEIMTVSGGVEKITDALTKQPMMINVDDSSLTGQGARDIRVQTTIDTNPLRITTIVERLGLVTPPDLKVLVTFPAYFYTGEAADPDGKPYWSFGYETQPGHAIPPDVTMTFSVDQTPGSEHTYDLDWSGTPASPLGFIMGVFQALDGDPTTPVLPAFSNFVADPMPTGASLTLDTFETPTSSTKCFQWTADQPFRLSFDYSEAEVIGGVDTSFDLAATIDQVPSSLEICATEDRAAHTYGFDYVASAPVDLLDLHTEIVPVGAPIVTIDLGVEALPSEIHAVLGDGSLVVDVADNVGLVRLDAVADDGLGAIDSLHTLRMRIQDVPDLAMTWFQGGAGNGAALTAPSCIGSLELAFSFGALLLPGLHASDPQAHYLFAHSDLVQTAIALRLTELGMLAFTQNNDVGGNELDLAFCKRNPVHILAHTVVGSLLTPTDAIELAVVMTEAPTQLGLGWTVPFALSLDTNEPIDSIVADLTLNDLVAHAELLDLPADMGWTIDPAGQIDFDSAGSIGMVDVAIEHPDALPGAAALVAGENIRLFVLHAHDTPGFILGWQSDPLPSTTGFTFGTDPGTFVGDLTLALSSDVSDYASLGGLQPNRAFLYHDDTLAGLDDGAGNTFSMFLRLDDLTRAGYSFGGSTPTWSFGYGAATSHPLKASAQLDDASSLNPAAPEALLGTANFQNLPAAVDFSIAPDSGFTYAASDVVTAIIMDATIGEPPANPTFLHADLAGLPTTASGTWSLASPGQLDVLLGARLAEIDLSAEDADGLFGTPYTRVDGRLLDVPEGIHAAWDAAARSASLSFLDGTYTEGLGELKLVATNGGLEATTSYVNSLGAGSTCMTSYSEYTRTIDARYWPPSVPGRLEALYCRHPVLDPVADDYVFARSGNDGTAAFDALGVRIRELASLAAAVGGASGAADVEFSRDLELARSLIVVADDFDGDDRTIVEIERLPDGQPSNTLHADYNVPGGHFGYALSEPIPFIDIYSGEHASGALDSDYTKVVLQNVPSMVTLDFAFQDREGFFDFIASSPWEMGFLTQEDGKRTLGWLMMQSLTFDYSFALPGEESCDHGFDFEFCFRVFRLEVELDALPIHADGMLGTYNLKPSPAALTDPGGDGGEPAPGAQEFIPEWAFLLNDFDVFSVDVDWDVFAGISVDPIEVGANILPSVSIEADFQIFVDYFWNERIEETIVEFFIPLVPPPCSVIDGIVILNSVEDYREQRPIHLWPFDGDGPFSLVPDIVETDAPSDPFDCWNYDASLTVEVPGFHRRNDHPNIF